MVRPLMHLKDETGKAWVPHTVSPGAEMEALSRFFWNGSWKGTVMADGMGPGSPEMDARGKSRCPSILGGLWFSCDLSQDQFVDGKKVLSWKARWIIGWDFMAQGYRAVGVDSNGIAFIFRGEIRGDRLVAESLGDSPIKLRFTWDAGDPEAVTWKNEMSVGGGPFALIEEYVMTRD